MIAVVQRVQQASAAVAGEVVGRIGRGLCILAAVERGDGEPQARWMARKLTALRIFPGTDPARAFDRDVREIGGAVLLVSNFTIAASCAKGRRPSLEPAAGPAEAEPVFQKLVDFVRAEDVSVQTGRFGADMQVTLVNDGPVTFTVRTPG